jgi:hypothetical protein
MFEFYVVVLLFGILGILAGIGIDFNNYKYEVLEELRKLNEKQG